MLWAVQFWWIYIDRILKRKFEKRHCMYTCLCRVSMIHLWLWEGVGTVSSVDEMSCLRRSPFVSSFRTSHISSTAWSEHAPVNSWQRHISLFGNGCAWEETESLQPSTIGAACETQFTRSQKCATTRKAFSTNWWEQPIYSRKWSSRVCPPARCIASAASAKSCNELYASSLQIRVGDPEENARVAVYFTTPCYRWPG